MKPEDSRPALNARMGWRCKAEYLAGRPCERCEAWGLRRWVADRLRWEVAYGQGGRWEVGGGRHLSLKSFSFLFLLRPAGFFSREVAKRGLWPRWEGGGGRREVKVGRLGTGGGDGEKEERERFKRKIRGRLTSTSTIHLPLNPCAHQRTPGCGCRRSRSGRRCGGG